MLPVRTRLRHSLALVGLFVAMIALMLLDLNRRCVVSFLSKIGRMLYMLFRRYWHLHRLQRFTDQSLMLLLILVDDMQKRLLSLRRLVVVRMSRCAIDFTRLGVKTGNVRLLARSVLALFRRTLVRVQQRRGGLFVLLLSDLLTSRMLCVA